MSIDRWIKDKSEAKARKEQEESLGFKLRKHNKQPDSIRPFLANFNAETVHTLKLKESKFNVYE